MIMMSQQIILLKMSFKKISQSEIDALLKQSDLEESRDQNSQIQKRVKQTESYYRQKELDNYQSDLKHEQTSNQYGQDQFQSYQQSRRTQKMNKNLQNKIKQSQYLKKYSTYQLQNQQPPQFKSSVYDSYAQDQFQSYQQSKKPQYFQQSQYNPRVIQNIETNQLKQNKYYPQNNNTQIAKKVSFQQPDYFDPQQKNHQKTHNYPNNNKQVQMIKTSNQTQIQPKSKAVIIKYEQVKENKNLAYNYNRLQQRQKELLFTSLTQENKQLKQLLSQKDKQLTATKTKYNILLQEKAQVLGNAKQATFKKQFELLQAKYDNLLKQKAKQRTSKTAQMSKTMNNNFVLQQQAQSRENQLLVIVQKLKQRLISTDKQLKTLQQKMNQGLDYQQELQRKLKRVEQLELRMEKMKIQADQDRALIEMLKEKSKQQKNRIQELQQEKNQLNLSLKRAQMTQATQNDFKLQLQEVKREKQLLQKSLKQISMNFTNNLLTNKGKIPKEPELQDIIQDSNELLSYKKR